MSTISPQIPFAVNEFPETIRPLISQLLTELKSIFEVSAHTPSSFAQAESELVAAMVRLGRGLVLSLASTFAAESEMVSVSSKHEDVRLFRRLEPTSFDIVTPFGRGSIQRSLYREVGVHNGPSIDPVALRCGLMMNATPRAVQIIGAFVGAVPSREAETLLRQIGIDTLSRSAIERTAQAFGQHLEDHRDPLDTALLEVFTIPPQATTISVSVDRVAVPIEKPRRRRPGRPRKADARRPVEVVYQMAYVLCWTLYGADNKPLYTARGGRMPYDGAGYEVEERLRWDLLQLMEQCPSLKVVALSDGAAEMVNLLQRVTKGIEVEVQLIDFWHAIEYVANASRALERETTADLVKAKKDLLAYDDGAVRLLERLKRWKTKRQKEKKPVPKPLSDAIRYIENKNEAGLMNYSKAHRAGLPIGSGTIEATAKTLVSIRMKRAGSRWKHHSGQHVLTLRSHLMSDRWSDVMNWHVAHNDDQLPVVRDVA